MKLPLGHQPVYIENYQFAVEGEERRTGAAWICTEVDSYADAVTVYHQARARQSNRKRSVKIVMRAIGRWMDAPEARP